MSFRSIFKKHSDIASARRQAVFWLTIPTVVVIMLVALFVALQSSDSMTTLRYTFDEHSSAFINDSLWWVICMNITGALLTASLIGWCISLYYGYRSLRTYWRVGRPRARKAQQKRRLYWTALGFTAAPLVLFVIWYALGEVVQFVTQPATPVIAITNDYPSDSLNYWSSYFIPELLMFALPFCLVISIYCIVKRNRL